MSHPRAILESLGAAARKSLSQNFLLSPHWADKLATEAISIEADQVWEIGPGLGALTLPLLQKAKVPVTLFEYDRKLAEYLRATFPQVPLIEGDVLDQDLAGQAKGDRISVLSNLPYHLSSAILFRLSELPKVPVQLVLTFQREFAERVSAKPRTPSYGAMSVLLQLQYDVVSLGVIPPGAFYPVPDIDSEALRLRPKGPAISPVLRTMVRAAFQQRRKRLAGNLKKAFPSLPVDSALEKLGISPNARPEELAPADYQGLALALGLGIS